LAIPPGCCDLVNTAFSGITAQSYLRFMERARTNHLRLMGAEQHALLSEGETETPGFAFGVRSMTRFPEACARIVAPMLDQALGLLDHHLGDLWRTAGSSKVEDTTSPLTER
jgi:hypothetical protein